MGIYSYYRISKAATNKVPSEEKARVYKSLRNKTFWGVTIAYSLYYVCRMSLSVIKQPLIDADILSAGELGIIGSSLFFVYAIGKFVNGFLADYCNIRRFMFIGIFISAILNLLMGLLGLVYGWISFTPILLFLLFALFWGINGWSQSMGAAPGVISLSRWFPLSERATYYSIFSASPYLGEFLSFIIVGFVVGALGWQFGFLFASLMGAIGALIIYLLVSDTPESKGLPSIQVLSNEMPSKVDKTPTIRLQKQVFRNKGIWIIAVSSAFIYIVNYAVTGWGVLFLQKSSGFSIESATQIIAFSTFLGILGTILAGWLSDKVFKGNRIYPTLISGIISLISLCLFLFVGGSYLMNIIYVSIFSLASGILYCIVAGLMAIDIVPRKATGSALGIVGISSYIAAGIQDIVSGYLIQGYVETNGSAEIYDFTPVSIFWVLAALISFVLPVLNWHKIKKS